MTLMKQLASADFRKKYTALAEPYAVTAHGKVIGKWYPTGSDAPVVQEAVEEVVETGPEPGSNARMTIRPVKGPVRTMVATEKRILDPLEVKRRERANYSQLASRLYGPRRQPKG